MTTAAPALAWERCRLCHSRLKPEDDLTRGVCRDCQGRPEAGRLAVGTNGAPPPAKPVPARAFTAAERSLIRAMHGYVPADELLRILTERMQADLGSEAPAYSMEQLHREIRLLAGAGDVADDWTALRRFLDQARRSGLLAGITPVMLEDFAVVFALSVAQLMHLQDVMQHVPEVRP